MHGQCEKLSWTSVVGIQVTRTAVLSVTVPRRSGITGEMSSSVAQNLAKPHIRFGPQECYDRHVPPWITKFAAMHDSEFITDKVFETIMKNLQPAENFDKEVDELLAEF